MQLPEGRGAQGKYHADSGLVYIITARDLTCESLSAIV